MAEAKQKQAINKVLKQMIKGKVEDYYLEEPNQRIVSADTIYKIITYVPILSI